MTKRLLPRLLLLLLLLLHLRRHLVVWRDGRDVRVAAADVRVLAAIAVIASRRHRSVVEVDAPDPTLVRELLNLPSPLALGNLCLLERLGPDRPLLHARLEVAELHRELRRHLEQLGVGHRAERVVGRRMGVLGRRERVHRLRLLLLLLLLRRDHLLLLERLLRDRPIERVGGVAKVGRLGLLDGCKEGQRGQRSGSVSESGSASSVIERKQTNEVGWRWLLADSPSA